MSLVVSGQLTHWVHRAVEAKEDPANMSLVVSGQLTHWVHRAVEAKEDTCFVLIDRSHVRNKVGTGILTIYLTCILRQELHGRHCHTSGKPYFKVNQGFS